MSVLDGLAACAGQWQGTSTLEVPHAGVADESASTLAVTPMIGGRFVRIDYTWSYDGKPQEGALIVGFQRKAGVVTAHWMDSFHNGENVMVCTGTPSDDGILSVRGSYAAPTGPDWGWRIDVTPGAEMLRIVHHNVWPEGKEELAVDSRYTRA
jgi:hypothetical protein